MDHGIGYTMGYYRDHFGAHTGMEVVLPNGEVMRTGMGAMPASQSWQEYRHGYGPDPAGLFGQGNFGIVTKMGFRLMPAPEHWRNGLVTVPKRQDLIPLVEVVELFRRSVDDGRAVVRQPADRADAATREFREAALAFNEAEMDRHAAAANLHSWQVELQFYGSERTTLANWEYAKELVARKVPGARFTDGESLKTPLTREQIATTTGPYPTNMRRNITQGRAGARHLVHDGPHRAEPERVERDAHRLVLAGRPQRRGRAASAEGLRRRSRASSRCRACSRTRSKRRSTGISSRS